jgi:hypothetical protein
MFEIEVSGGKQFDRFVETGFKERVVAFEYMLVREVVEHVFAELQDGIKDANQEEWMKVYKQSMKVYEISGLSRKVSGSQKAELGFVIASQVAGDWNMVDAGTMLVSFKRSLDDPSSAVGEVLERFSPFTVDNVPNLDFYGAKTYIRVVRASEVAEVREANADKAHELQEALAEVGLTQKAGLATIDGKIFFDMEWAVIRMETGHSAHGKAHWRPALKQISVALHEKSMSVEFHKKIKKIFEPKNVRWASVMEGPESLPEIRVQDLKVFRSFQERVSQSHM